MSSVRRKLEMAVRVRDFNRAHPFSDPSHEALVVRLADLVARAAPLAVQEQAGRLGAAAANRHRRELRRGMHHALIRYLARVGEFASHEVAEFAGRFRAPAHNGSNAAFLARAWDLLNLARQHEEVLARHGLAASQLDLLASDLTAYEAATERANAGRREHVGARADLLKVTAELMDLVRLMDVLNRSRFAEQAEPLAAWISAANVVGPFRGKGAEQAQAPVPEPPGEVPPNEGGSERAA